MTTRQIDAAADRCSNAAVNALDLDVDAAARETFRAMVADAVRACLVADDEDSDNEDDRGDEECEHGVTIGIPCRRCEEEALQCGDEGDGGAHDEESDPYCCAACQREADRIERDGLESERVDEWISEERGKP